MVEETIFEIYLVDRRAGVTDVGNPGRNPGIIGKQEEYICRPEETINKSRS